VDDEYYDMKIRNAAKKFERVANALWAICFGITLIYLIIAAYYNVPMIAMGAAMLSTLIVTRAIIETAEDIKEEIRKMCRGGSSP